jgi:hypothetical protein
VVVVEVRVCPLHLLIMKTEKVLVSYIVGSSVRAPFKMKSYSPIALMRLVKTFIDRLEPEKVNMVVSILDPSALVTVYVIAEQSPELTV